MRKSYIEIIVGILVAVSVLLVLASGYLSYKSLSSIVNSIHSATVRDHKLDLIKTIATNLEKGEQSIRLYTFSKNENDLKPYKMFLMSIDSNLDDLRESGKDNPLFLRNIDTITDLIDDKIEVWNEILAFNNSHLASQFLDTISKQLETKVINDSLRKNRSVFKKIFKRQKKVDIDEEKMIMDIQQIKDKREKNAARIVQKEKQLAENSNQITDQLYNLIKKMEEQETQILQMRVANADDQAKETYRWIGWIALSGTISALLVIFVLSRYLRRSRAYQQALIASKKEAEDLARTKERFIANVSHELKTPMGIIAGFVEQLLKKPLENSIENTLRIIKSSSDHLVSIIGDILDFSKLQSGKMKLKPTHFLIDNVIIEIKLLFESNASQNNITFEIKKGNNLPPVLYGDQLRLKQILINLIGNAIKFTNEGKVETILNADNFKADCFKLILHVEDTGIGIDTSDLEQIFQDFMQVEITSAKNYNGTGLGLSIVKQLIDLHNGKIEVRSEKNKGTIFTCIIPYKIGDESKIEETKIGIADIPQFVRNLRFLCVDDEPYNRKLMQVLLQKWKLSFSEAENGIEAIEKIRTGKYDVVLMDVRMPGMDGFAAAKYIRESLHLGPDTLAIILSTATSVTEDGRKKLKKQGFNGYLPKPFTEDQLFSVLNSIFYRDNKSIKEKEIGKENNNISKQRTSQKHINLSDLLKFAENDEKFVKEMLEKFIVSFETGIQTFKTSFDEKNRKQITDVAHKLASPCRHIGADILLTKLKRIESDTDNLVNFDEIKDYIISAEIEFSGVKKEIENYLSEIKNN